jgi:hypothetical protein
MKKNTSKLCDMYASIYTESVNPFDALQKAKQAKQAKQAKVDVTPQLMSVSGMKGSISMPVAGSDNSKHNTYVVFKFIFDKSIDVSEPFGKVSDTNKAILLAALDATKKIIFGNHYKGSANNPFTQVVATVNYAILTIDVPCHSASLLYKDLSHYSTQIFKSYQESVSTLNN